MAHQNSKNLIQENWERYEYGRTRGHSQYIIDAKRNEELYLGGGLQWRPEDKAKLKRENRPFLEFNEVMNTVNAATGYQIANRMDISLRPRNSEADQAGATLLSKIAKQITDDTQYHWKETDAFEDGLIMQRGYFDIRMSFDDSLTGDISVELLAPPDVIPDPDSKSYNPDHWEDVIITRWMTPDQIEQWYGRKKRIQVEQMHEPTDDFEEMSTEERNKFGDNRSGAIFYDSVQGKKAVQRVRVIDRQYWRMVTKEVLITENGDIRTIENLSDEERAELEEEGGVITKRRTRCVYWCVSTSEVLLYNGQSPFRHFTVVPYFPFFRRGMTRGIVDNIVGPQEMYNKAMSQILHVLNTSANSGWKIEQNSLTNMTADELEERGAQTGLVLEYRQGSQEPQKIEPNKVPTGLDRMVDRSISAIRNISGINESLLGQDERDLSGVAIQSRQFAAQQQLARPLDNLARTRHMVAQRFIELIQDFYDEPRVMRITDQDQSGRQVDQFVEVNQDNGMEILNDLTAGEYDVVITEQPISITFENSQFEQAKQLRQEMGVPIPDHYLIRHSSLSDKHELADTIEKQPPPPEAQKVQAEIEKMKADMQRIAAETERIKNDAVNKSVESMYSSIQTAAAISQDPLIAGISDRLLRSAGFVDRDEPPIVPESGNGGASQGPPPDEGAIEALPQGRLQPETNTNPLTPTNPDDIGSPLEGVNRGIETLDFE